jgi:hypothetical protein
MAYRGVPDSHPFRFPPRSASYDSPGGISSRISSFSDFNSPETPLTGYYDTQDQKIELRDVTPYHPHSSNVTSRLNEAHNDGADIVHAHKTLPIGGDYEPLSPGGSSTSGKGIVGRPWQKSLERAIPEGDETDMGNHNRFAHVETGYVPIINEPGQDEEIDTLGVDISSFTGPLGEATAKEYRRLESGGKLTGGLGVGLKPELRISGRALWASASLSVPPATPIDLTRRISRQGLTRNPTLRDLGQREANKRGKIIEVVVENPFPDSTPFHGPGAAAAVDLSIVSGGGAHRDPPQGRNGTSALPKLVTYYPQPNWKPISMRWPYLLTLIIVSIGLAVGQEFLYQKSNSKSQANPPSGLFEFTSPKDISTWDYFSFRYLPTVIAVTFGILWQLTDFEVKRLEPYYRLSKEAGALAAESINVDYITVFNIFRPLRAIRYKHYAVAVSSVATLLAVSLVPTMQSASFVLEPDPTTRHLYPEGQKFIVVNAVWSRVLSATLLLISLLGVILLYQLQRRRSGLMGDVKGIAGIAAMATKSHVLMDFKGLDTVPPQDIHNKLKDHRYTLRNTSLVPDDAVPLTREDKDKYDQYRLSANPHPLMMRLVAGIPLIASMVLYLIFIPTVIFIPSANVVSYSVPFLFTAIAVAIKIAFQTLEQAVRMMEPFYRLSCRHAPPKVLNLDYTGMAFGYMPIRAFLNGDYLVCFVGLGSVFAEILTVSVTTFVGVEGKDFFTIGGSENADDGEETMSSFWITLVLSLAILAYLILVALAVYKFRRHPFLPRQPSTIASILAFVHQSKMLYDFVAVPQPASEQRLPPSTTTLPNNPPNNLNSPSTSLTSVPTLRPRKGVTLRSASTVEDQSVLVQRLTAMGKTYGFGWFTGRDGETHCGVDQEELRHDYHHTPSEDARKAAKPWLENWQHY